MGEADAEALVGHRAFREVLHGRAELRKRILLDHLCRSPQRENVEAKAAALQLQQLLEHERLREPWKAVDEHHEVCGGGGRLHGSRIGLDGRRIEGESSSPSICRSALGDETCAARACYDTSCALGPTQARRDSSLTPQAEFVRTSCRCSASRQREASNRRSHARLRAMGKRDSSGRLLDLKLTYPRPDKRREATCQRR